MASPVETPITINSKQISAAAASRIKLSKRQYHACQNTLCSSSDYAILQVYVMIKWRAGTARFFSSLRSPPNWRRQVQAVCSTHGRAGAVNTQHLAVNPGWGSVSPPGICSRKVHHVQGLSPLAFTEEKVNKMVEQIQVT